MKLHTISESPVSLAKQFGRFSILTSNKPHQADNEYRFSELKKHLQNLGLNHLVLRGHWQETDEPSLLVPNIDLQTAKKLGNLYNQDAIVYCGPETSRQTVMVGRDGSMKLTHLRHM